MTPILPTLRRAKYRGNPVWEADARAQADRMRAYGLPARKRFPTRAAAEAWITEVAAITIRPPVEHHGTRVRDLRERYLRACEGGAVSETTAYQYGRQTKVFQDFCAEYGIEYVDQISRTIVGEYEDWMRARYAPTSVTTYMGGARRFISWGVEREIIDRNVFSRAVPSSRAPERRILTPAESKRITTRAALPWRHLWIVMLDTGLRISEAAGIGSTTHHKGDHLVVLGKGKKVRRTPLSEPGAAAVLASIEAGIVPSKRSTVDYHFGKMRSALKLTGIVPHSLRHTYISEMANVYGVPLSVLQLWVGHERLATTETYLHADWTQSRGAVDERGKRW